MVRCPPGAGRRFRAGILFLHDPEGAASHSLYYSRILSRENGSFRQFDVPTELVLQDLDELGVHIAVVIGNVQADDLLPLESLLEFAPQPLDVSLFHHEDQVSPAQMAFRDSDSGASLRSRRPCRAAVDPLDQGFRGEASPSVLAAYEEELHGHHARRRFQRSPSSGPVKGSAPRQGGSL